MPEGPSLVIAREMLEVFKNKKIKLATGNAKVDMSLLKNKLVVDIKTWGKQLFIFTQNGPVIRVHFLMFGSYSINEQTKPDERIRLCLHIGKSTLFFYTCSVKFVDDPAGAYDWSADIMSDLFSIPNARRKLRAMPESMVCDALLDQQVFSGAGNIIKNEVLYRICVHPESTVGKLPATLLNKLIKETRNYSFDFLKWKKAFELKKHWLAHTKKQCKRCDLPMIKSYCGKTKRRSFFCVNCQVKYE